MNIRRVVQAPLYHRYEAHMWRLSVPSPQQREFYRWRPPTNAYETEGGGMVVVEVAGLRQDDFQVAFREGRLTIAGVRREPETRSAVACHQMEIASGGFRTDVDVAWPVDSEHIRVDYREGFIRVFLPYAPGGKR